MDRLIITAIWDPEARVWVAESEQLPLVTEAPTLDALVAKLPGIIQDLLDNDAASDVPFELVARVDETVLVRRGGPFLDSV